MVIGDEPKNLNSAKDTQGLVEKISSLEEQNEELNVSDRPKVSYSAIEHLVDMENREALRGQEQRPNDFTWAERVMQYFEQIILKKPTFVQIIRYYYYCRK